MLLMPNKKKIASVIVAGLRAKKPDYVQALGEPSGTGEFKAPEAEAEANPLEGVMAEFLQAVESKDTKAMAEILKDAVYLCQAEEPAEREEA